MCNVQETPRVNFSTPRHSHQQAFCMHYARHSMPERESGATINYDLKQSNAPR